ncbi:Cytidine deaminase [Rhodotorula toruloides]|nr:Cytidine deaminase [Rhodotorula toruloides]
MAARNCLASISPAQTTSTAPLTRPPTMPAAEDRRRAVEKYQQDIWYSARYSDDEFEYRHVILPKALVKYLPKDRLAEEDEWRSLGVQQTTRARTAHHAFQARQGQERQLDPSPDTAVSRPLLRLDTRLPARPKPFPHPSHSQPSLLPALDTLADTRNALLYRLTSSISLSSHQQPFANATLLQLRLSPSPSSWFHTFAVLGLVFCSSLCMHFVHLPLGAGDGLLSGLASFGVAASPRSRSFRFRASLLLEDLCAVRSAYEASPSIRPTRSSSLPACTSRNRATPAAMVVYTPLPLSPSNRKTLISSALSARDGSYSPYSNFRVGACLLTDEGEFVSGANVECASYGGAICAERTAIVKGVSEGKRRFVALARRQRNGLAVWDLQAGLEGVLSARVLLIPSSYVEGKTPTKTATEAEGADTEDTVVETTMGELLPLSFGPEDLRKPRPGAGEGKA